MKSKRIFNAETIRNSVAIFAGASTISMNNITPVLATTSTGVEQVDTGLNVIKGLAIGVCAVIGVISLVKGGMTFSSGLSQRDQSGIVTGGLEIAGGLVMAAIGAIIGLMGF